MRSATWPGDGDSVFSAVLVLWWEEVGMPVEGSGGSGDGDEHPGQPWTPPQDPPSPDGEMPPGDGKHRA
ncbi:hypothetical protein GCM10027168_14040 [Streptomyces capparidis]